MEDGVMVDDGVIEEECVGLAPITPKATRKMPKQKRKLGRYAARRKKNRKNIGLLILTLTLTILLHTDLQLSLVQFDPMHTCGFRKLSLRQN